MPSNIDMLNRFETFSKSPLLNQDYVYQYMIKNTTRYFSKFLFKLQYSHTLLLSKRCRIVEALYYEWTARILKVLQGIDGIRDSVEAKN